MNASESLADFVFENVGVNFLTLDQGETPLKLQALHLEHVAFEFELRELLLIFLAGFQPALSMHGVPDEIARHTAGDGDQHERKKKLAREDTAEQHGASLRPPWCRRG